MSSRWECGFVVAIFCNEVWGIKPPLVMPNIVHVLCGAPPPLLYDCISSRKCLWQQKTYANCLVRNHPLSRRSWRISTFPAAHEAWKRAEGTILQASQELAKMMYYFLQNWFWIDRLLQFSSIISGLSPASPSSMPRVSRIKHVSPPLGFMTQCVAIHNGSVASIGGGGAQPLLQCNV